MSKHPILTEIESNVLSELKKKAIQITSGKPISINKVKSVVAACSAWNFPTMFKNEDPDTIVKICKELINKKFVKLYFDNDMPSFVPISATKIVEYSYRDFTQNDIY